MVLVGNLKDLRLANIIQINCIEQNVAKVTVSSLDRRGFIYFSEGKIVHAEFNPFIGERAVQEMLALTDGKFKVEAEIEAPAFTIDRPWNSVVLEALRLIDEKNQQLTPIPKRIFNLLTEIPGVQRVYVLDYHGKLVEGKLDGKIDPFSLAFIWYKLKKVMTLLYNDFFTYTFLRNSRNYIFIFEVRPNLIIIETDIMMVIPEFVNQVNDILKDIL